MFGKERRQIAELKAQIVGYESRLKEQQEALETLKERNRKLEALVSEYTAKEKAISESLIAAAQKSEELKKQAESLKEVENGSMALLAEQCRALLDELLRKYPDSGDIQRFEAFTDQLNGVLEESILDEAAIADGNFSMDEVLNPSKDLSLEQLCKDLGLMEEKK